MSDRERWIVYPLLLLALGTALRDKVTRVIQNVNLIEGSEAQFDLHEGKLVCRQVFCRDLVVVDEQGRSQVVIRAEKSGPAEKPMYYGSVRTFVDGARPVSQLGPVVVCRGIDVLDELNRPVVQIGSMGTPDGKPVNRSSPIATYGARGELLSALGPKMIVRDVEVVAPDNSIQIALRPTSFGGRISLLDRLQETVLEGGQFRDFAGLATQQSNGKMIRVLPLAARVPLPPEPPYDEPPDDAAKKPGARIGPAPKDADRPSDAPPSTGDQSPVDAPDAPADADRDVAPTSP
jgi:hypothetical protein